MFYICVMATVKIDTIPSDSIIDMKISGAFYEQLKIVLLSQTEKVKPDDLMAMLERFKNPQPAENAEEHTIYTLLVLINEIERKAKEQGLTKVQEVVLPD